MTTPVFRLVMALCFFAAVLVVIVLPLEPDMPPGQIGIDAVSPEAPVQLERIEPISWSVEADLEEVLSRPLFSESRRPPDQGAVDDREVAAASPTKDEPDLQLVGIVKVEGANMAIVRDMHTLEVYWAREGTNVGELEVERISENTIYLTGNDRHFAVDLIEFR